MGSRRHPAWDLEVGSEAADTDALEVGVGVPYLLAPLRGVGISFCPSSRSISSYDKEIQLREQ